MPSDKSYTQGELFEELADALAEAQRLRGLDGDASKHHWMNRWREARARVPLDVKLKVLDVYGRQLVHAGTWEVVETWHEEGVRGLVLTTGLTDIDGAGVRGECEVRVGI